MAALDVFNAIGSQVDSDFLAVDVLPILWQFSLGPLLNLGQFQAYMMLIKSLSARVENEQTRKLQELGATNAPATSRNEFMSFGGLPGTNGLDATNGDGGGDFEALVRGNQSASTGVDMLGGDPWANGPASASSSATLPSRPAANRSGSARNASPAATFAWSTPPVSPPPTNLAAPQLQGGMRNITPDNTMNSLNSSFPAMAPTNPGIGSSFCQAQQKPMNSMMSPVTTTPNYTPQSSGIDWTKASGTSSLSSNPWSSSGTTPSGSSGLSNFTTSPQPAQQSNPYSAFGIAPPPIQSKNSFSIAPPPSTGGSFNITLPPGLSARANSQLSMNSMASRTGQQQQQQNQQKPSSTPKWGSGGDSLI